MRVPTLGALALQPNDARCPALRQAPGSWLAGAWILPLVKGPHRLKISLVTAFVLGLVLTGCDWATYHANAGRTGVLPTFSSATTLTGAWSRTLDGAVYASPIVHDGNVFVATEGGSIYSFTASGGLRWRTHMANPVRLGDLATRGVNCGNIDPLGITGTPVFDPVTGRIFAVDETLVTGSVQHQLVAVNPTTGAVIARRLVQPPHGVAAAHQQRGALAVTGGHVLVTFGGLNGDCGNYVGAVVSIRTDMTGAQTSYSIPTSREGGIWTPPGPTVLADGSILVTDGNGASTTTYDGSDSVVHLSAGLRLLDRFSPSTWQADNAADLDLGSMGPAVTSNGYVVQSGKRGVTYVLRLSHLGGIRGQVSSVTGCRAFGGAAVSGSTVFLPCTNGVQRADIGSNGSIRVSWQSTGVPGSPVIYGNSLLATAQSQGRLYLLDPTSGRTRASLFVGSLSRFATPALDSGRAYVGTLTGLVAVRIG